MEIEQRTRNGSETLAAVSTLRALGLASVRISAADLAADPALRATIKQMQSEKVAAMVRKRELKT